MHDIDRTILESERDIPGDEFEADFEDEYAGEYGDEEYFQEDGYEFENVFDESEEMELAAELLNVSNEDELEYFLGGLFKRVGQKFRKFIKSKAGSALGKALKGIAKKALPIAGGALGSFIGGPAGGAIGSKLASSAGRIFGLELEGLSPEDQEFEIARRIVRLSGDAAKTAALAPPTADPFAVAKTAVTKAAQKHAPGLIRPIPPRISSISGSGRSGRWIRRGRKIILYGI